MSKSKIEWTEKTINPTMGCNIVSKGCDECYAMKMAHRLEKMGQKGYEGTTRKLKSGRIVWTGKINFDIEKFHKAVKTKIPTRFFVDSMSDLFHEKVPFEFIDEVFAIMHLSPQHIFQILTKRPEIMLKYCLDSLTPFRITKQIDAIIVEEELRKRKEEILPIIEYPLKNVHLGTSVEDQKTADERIPILLQVPAAVRWISAEPLLGRLDPFPYLYGMYYCDECKDVVTSYSVGEGEEYSHSECSICSNIVTTLPGLDWIVIGAESKGRKAGRECEQWWVEGITTTCKNMNVPVFVKQLQLNGNIVKDVNRFPKHLQIREYPQ